jgi:hypothetical protein
MHNPVFGLAGLFIAWFLFSPFFNFVFPGVVNLIYWGSHFA